MNDYTVFHPDEQSDFDDGGWDGHEERTARQTFRATVAAVVTKAKAALPECNGRVESAEQIVLNGDVQLLPDGSARVGSQSQAATLHVVHSSCDCRDYPHAPHGQCKHKIAVGIATRVAQLMQVTADATVTSAPETPPSTVQTLDAPSPVTQGKNGVSEPSVPPQYIVTIQGRPFVQYAGLLALAHERGLVSLKARFISVTAELALAESRVICPPPRKGIFQQSHDSG
jgi:hypothetical protein